MTLDSEVGLISNRVELIDMQADIDLHDTVTISAGEVMMVFAATHAIVMRAISEFDAIKQTQRD